MNLTIILIIITVIISITAWNKPDLINKWIFNPYIVRQSHQYWRFLTSGFLHSNGLHLFFNMLALFFFGDVIHRVFETRYGDMGDIYYLVLYLGGIVISEIPTYFKHKNHPGYNSLGASGGVASVLFGAILYKPTSTIYVYFIPLPAFVLGALYLIYSYFQSKRMADNVNHDAHLFGALYGIFLTVVLNPGVVQTFFRQIIHFKLI